jgi:hypothetical protein
MQSTFAMNWTQNIFSPCCCQTWCLNNWAVFFTSCGVLPSWVKFLTCFILSVQSHQRTMPILLHSVHATTWKETVQMVAQPLAAVQLLRERGLRRCANYRWSRRTSRTSCSTAELPWSCSSTCSTSLAGWWDVCGSLSCDGSELSYFKTCGLGAFLSAIRSSQDITELFGGLGGL